MLVGIAAPAPSCLPAALSPSRTTHALAQFHRAGLEGQGRGRARGSAGSALREAPPSAPAGSSRTRRGAHPRHPPRDPRLPAILARPRCHLCAASSSNISALMGHAGHVKELWQNMVVLDVYDSKLWDAPNLAWEVVLGALNLVAQ
ncbi:hypothetical protein DFH09DRAFT_1473688 [Mycena vulgaris]|nr:hypothetical protein DFH09DRAFT_1473688 [Mycena vulgaris]